MHPVVQDKLEALRGLCLRHRVARLDVFGSAARGDFDPTSSDLDFQAIERSRKILYEAA